MAFATGEAVWGTKADDAARRYGVDPNLFRRLIKQESGWNPNAGSSAGARGLTQVVPKWHPNANLSTPEGQLDYGAKHLGSLLKKYGNPRDALAVYNSGKPWKVSQAYGETNNYVKNILNGYQSSGTGAVSRPAVGGISAPSAPTATGPLLTPELDAELGQFAQSSADAVWRGDVGGLPSVFPLAQKIDKRRKQVMSSASGLLGAEALPGGEAQGAVDSLNGIDPVTAAQAKIGTPYSWGGGTPSGPTRGFGRGANTIGFDCSSLVQYAWAKAGVKLPRTTYEQIKVGTAVPNLRGARAGDLLFPHTGHVMLYMGNGRAIEAPYTGGRVREVNVSARKFIAIRRPKG